MSTQTLTLTLFKSTKGTHVYGDDSDDAPIPSVYIKKHALPKVPPETITVVISHD